MRRQMRCWKGWRRKHERPNEVCGRIRQPVAAVGMAEAGAAKGKGLNGLLRGRVWKWSFYVVLESDFIGWRVGDPCTFLPSETTRNERSFEKERQRAAGQREWAAKHPLPRRWRGVEGLLGGSSRGRE